MKKFLTILLLVVTTFAFGENELPPAIQSLKNAGLTIWQMKSAKWKTNSNGRVKILNDDGTVFIDCASFKFYSEGRYGFFREMNYVPAWSLEHKEYIGQYAGRATYAVAQLAKGEEKWEGKDFDILDEDGNSILQFPIDDASGLGYVDGKCAVKVGKLWGFIDRDGNWLCEPKFEGASFLDGKYGIISDEYGTAQHVGIINDQYEIIMPVTPHLFNVRRIEKDGRLAIYVQDKKNNYYEIEKLVDLYNANGQNLNKTLKVYQKLYDTSYSQFLH